MRKTYDIERLRDCINHFMVASRDVAVGERNGMSMVLTQVLHDAGFGTWNLWMMVTAGMMPPMSHVDTITLKERNDA